MFDCVLVTGGAGFIGSSVIRHLLSNTTSRVINVDKLTYAGNPETIRPFLDNDRYTFEQIDVCDVKAITAAMHKYKPDAVMHLAAESHVDRSIDGPADFIETNIVGTYAMLEAARDWWSTLNGARKDKFRFHHISTDEVFGSLGATGLFTETTAYAPNSPYSASKASSDHLVRAWHHTFGLPTVVSNCSNNYGPYQFPEKLIPVVLTKALAGEPIPIYGKGDNIRDWLYVDDHADALYTIVAKARPGETYNVGGNAEHTNLDLVKTLCAVLDDRRPRNDGKQYADQITFVADRPGHDMRYAIDASKIKNELGWEPAETLATGLGKTVDWYLENQAWVNSVLDGSYTGERLGVAS